jgi:hypothetical protein
MIAFPKRYTASPLGHSADVELWLHIESQKISLTHTCGTCVRLERDAPLPPGPAKLEIVVDGRSHLSDVTVTGRQADRLWVDIVRATPAAANQSAA